MPEIRFVFNTGPPLPTDHADCVGPHLAEGASYCGRSMRECGTINLMRKCGAIMSSTVSVSPLRGSGANSSNSSCLTDPEGLMKHLCVGPQVGQGLPWFNTSLKECHVLFYDIYVSNINTSECPKHLCVIKTAVENN